MASDFSVNFPKISGIIQWAVLFLKRLPLSSHQIKSLLSGITLLILLCLSNFLIDP